MPNDLLLTGEIHDDHRSNAGFVGELTEQVRAKSKFASCVNDVHMSQTAARNDDGLSDSVAYPTNSDIAYPTNSDCQLANVIDDPTSPDVVFPNTIAGKIPVGYTRQRISHADALILQPNTPCQGVVEGSEIRLSDHASFTNTGYFECTLSTPGLLKHVGSDKSALEWDQACALAEHALAKTSMPEVIRVDELTIIVDSGASAHMSPYVSLLKDRTPFNGGVRFGSSRAGLTRVDVIGNVWILKDVLHVPDLNYFLISVGCLDREGYRTVFNTQTCMVFNCDDEICLVAHLNDSELYEVDYNWKRVIMGNTTYVESSNNATTEFLLTDAIRVSGSTEGESGDTDASGIQGEQVGSEQSILQKPNDGVRGKRKLFNPNTSDRDFVYGSAGKRTNSTIGDTNPMTILHRRLGHWNEESIKSMVRSNQVVGLGYTWDQIKDLSLPWCPQCKQGKMRASTPKLPDEYHPYEAGEWWSFDIKESEWGTSARGFRYIIFFVDRKSKLKRSYLIKDKSDTLEVIKAHLTFLLSHSKTWKFALCDSENVNVSKQVVDFLGKNGITFHRSSPYAHHQNGLVESNIGHIMDTARTIMIDMKVPRSLWDYAVLHAVYVSNRMYRKELSSTPYQMFYGVAPDVSTLVPFYSPGVCHVTKDERARGGHLKNVKGRLIRMLGIDESGKDLYVVRDILNRSTLSRKDCEFNESTDPQVVRDLLQYYESVEDPKWMAKEPDEKDPSEFIRATRSMSHVKGSQQPDTEPVSTDIPKVSKDSDDESVVSGEGETTGESEFEDLQAIIEAYFRIHESNILESDYEEPSMPSVTSSSILDINVQGNDNEEDDWDYDEDDLETAVSYYTAAIAMNAPAIGLPPQPSTLQEALSKSNPHWKEWQTALWKEIGQLEERGSFQVADEQTGRGMKTRLLFRVSYDNDYKLKFKCRLVMCGYSQIKGVDYQDTYAPTPAIPTLFLQMHVAATLGYQIDEFDVTGAYLEGKNDFEMYCYLPKELGLARRRYRVINSVYGEKQAGRIWYLKNDSILVDKLKFIKCEANPNLYRRSTDDGKEIYITIHVDDGFITSTDQSLIDQFIEAYGKHLTKVTRYGNDAQKYLGMDFKKDGNYIYLSQSNYVKNTVLLGREKPPRKTLTPMLETVNLREAIKNPQNESLLTDTGTFRYLADRTRPDILNAVGEISSGGDKEPSDLHVQTKERIYNYLYCNPERVLKLGGPEPLKIFGFVDASFGLKTRIGGALFLGMYSGAFYTFSVTDRSVSLSSTEAEIKGIARLILPIMHFVQVANFLGSHQDSRVDLYCDNESAIEISKMLKMTEQVRHIQKIINFIRKKINQGVINLKWVPGDKNPADVLTKPLRREPFWRHSETLLSGFNGSFDF